jgi:hypothetical protein
MLPHFERKKRIAARIFDRAKRAKIFDEAKLLFSSSLIEARVTRGRCYDHNFLRFLPIFCEKIGGFSKTNVMINFLLKLALAGAKNANFFAKIFAKFFGENI